MSALFTIPGMNMQPSTLAATVAYGCRVCVNTSNGFSLREVSREIMPDTAMLAGVIATVDACDWDDIAESTCVLLIRRILDTAETLAIVHELIGY